MSWLDIIILAIVQGIAEFLPISSSGHLVVAEAVLEALGQTRPPELVEVSIVLHLGTLASILIYYWTRIWRLLDHDRRVVPLLIVGTLPAVVLGLSCKVLVPEILESLLVTGLMFPVTATLLLWTAWHSSGSREYAQMGYRDALLIGLFQAVAILPGISRSGSTIVAGLLVGLSRGQAATFAFLLAIPAITGAGVLEAKDMYDAGGSSTAAPLLILGFFVSMAVGYASLAGLIRIVERGSLYVFAAWLFPLGIAVTIWHLVR